MNAWSSSALPDGFLARADGRFDFCRRAQTSPTAMTSSGDGGCAGHGRKTFETVLSFNVWPYGEKPRSCSHVRLPCSPGGRGGVVCRRSVRHRLADLGPAWDIYVDGGITIQRFLAAGAIQRLVITRVPVLIGTGIPLFGALHRDIVLRHVATRQYASGLVQSEYEVVV